MCGIVGLYSLEDGASGQALEVRLRTMRDALYRRGPDSAGLWQDKEHPLVLGHRRLAILDLSPEGHQPMLSASQRYVISFNGEIYNYQDLEADLKKQGHSFRGHSDTEILLAAIEQYGMNETCQKINGMFAFILWDRKDQILHLVRDRFGKKPLYYGWAGKNLVIASELKAITAHPSFEKKINRDTLSLYMRYGYVPAPHSIYENIWHLMPGGRLSIPVEGLKPGDALQNKTELYWHMRRVVEDAKARQCTINDDDAINDFEKLLSQCISDRMVSDVPLGAFLSGGIDSSTIVALMQKQSTLPVRTYAIGFNEKGFDEAKLAADVAAHLGTEHHEHYVSAQEALDVIPDLPVIYDEPFADPSQIPTYLVSKFARQDVTVALSGDGGDEMLGGYNRHFVVPSFWKKARCFPRCSRQGMACLMKLVPPQGWDRIRPSHPQFGERMHKLAGLLLQKNRDEIYQYLVSQWQSPSSIVVDGQEPIIPVHDLEYQVEGLSFAEEMMYKDALSYLNGDILTKCDRANMAVSLEGRAPLLDRRIFEYVWGLPEHMKVRHKQGKWLLREVLARHVPRALFERPKQGFTPPVAAWLRGPLKEWAEDLLAPEKLEEQGLVVQSIRQCWDAHLSGKGNYALPLWTVLMFQAWVAGQSFTNK